MPVIETSLVQFWREVNLALALIPEFPATGREIAALLKRRPLPHPVDASCEISRARDLQNRRPICL
jgi:hypothetical protein